MAVVSQVLCPTVVLGVRISALVVGEDGDGRWDSQSKIFLRTQ
jgi:hypothetical protein